jgi:hypothetical protein
LYLRGQAPGNAKTHNYTMDCFVGSISNTGSLNIQLSGTATFPYQTNAANSVYSCNIFGNKYLQL